MRYQHKVDNAVQGMAKNQIVDAYENYEVLYERHFYNNSHHDFEELARLLNKVYETGYADTLRPDR